MKKVVWPAAGVLIIPSRAGLAYDEKRWHAALTNKQENVNQIQADNVITENLRTGMHVNKFQSIW
jgi:hypothetical protein